MASAEAIRNMCILAHVDHGKTTLADHLIAAAGGGVLHAKQAGKMRFMDYRDDEQQRAITMKSAGIVLRFRGNLINLIDSPGHVDFCSEVSTAVRLSDGALVLVDACEGVHIQTHAVLRQAWLERLKPCLVLNKLDRLITELKMSPSEAYARMQSIIMEVNNIINGFRSEKYMSDVDAVLTASTFDSSTTVNLEFEEEEDEEDAFSVEKGNVAFTCAVDGWGFRIEQFAALYAAKLGASANALRKALWGNYFFMAKEKKIVGKKAAGGRLKPMFVQFVLEPIWQVYSAALESSGSTEMLNKVIKSMNLTIPPRELQQKDRKLVLQSVMSRWLPLSDTVLSMVVECLPSPVSAMTERIERLLPKENSLDVDPELGGKLDAVWKAVKDCDTNENAPCVVFVSKMIAVPIEMLPRHGPHGELLSSIESQLQAGDVDAGGKECFLAFARVFSGVLSSGQRLYVLSALYDPTVQDGDSKNMQEGVVDAVYLMMGRGLDPVASASAGQLVAIRGLGQQILKTATLSSTTECWPFSSMFFQAAPIVRVALEPSDPADLGALTKGLRLLNRADPFVEVTISNSGEHVIAAVGEVHLERCIKDLRERFAGVNLEVSPPLVAFRETIEVETSIELGQSAAYPQSHITPNGRYIVRVNVTRLPSAVTQVLDESSDLIRGIVEGSHSSKRAGLSHSEKSEDDRVTRLRQRLIAAVDIEADTEKSDTNDQGSEGSSDYWRRVLNRIWALGPRRIGPNILILPFKSIISQVGTDANNDEENGSAPTAVRGTPLVSEKLGLVEEIRAKESSEETPTSLRRELESLESSVISGFQLATAQGPLCEEPMWGLAFTVEVLLNTRNSKAKDNSGQDELDSAATPSVENYGAVAGQIISAVKDACRAAVFSKHPRIAEALYFCEIITSPEHLGQVYAVLGKRRARVLKEEMKDGTALFVVHAYMPVAESFGFANDMRRRTSGFANPQLVLSHWESLAEDPFFVPKTEEELEEFGDGASVLQNTARKLIDTVRRRKGLPVEEKIVKIATKQRTLARKV